MQVLYRTNSEYVKSVKVEEERRKCGSDARFRSESIHWALEKDVIWLIFAMHD